MAEIQEYLPQVQAPEGVGSVSQNIELSGAVGKGIEQLGADINQGSMLLQRRNAQRESAQVYAHISDLSNDFTQKIQGAIQDGSLNQESMLQNFDDANQKMSESLETPQAQNYLTRLQTRFRGHLMKTMASGSAQIAKNEAIGGMLDARSKAGNAILQDPSSFQDQYEAGIEDVDQRIKTGGLPASMRDKAIRELGSDFATQAIRGWANLDTKTARQLLNGDKQSGKKPLDYIEGDDPILTPDKRQQLNLEIDRVDRNNEVEDSRQTKAINDAQKKNAEKWSADHFQPWQDNQLSTKDVTSAVQKGALNAEQGEKWIRLINERQKEDSRPNFTLYNTLATRIADPTSDTPIKSVDDIMNYVGHGINPTQVSSLVKLLKTTPEESAAAQGEKALFDSAKKTIRFKNMMTQQYDVLGEQKLAQFHADFAQAKDKLKSSGGAISELTNPNSKNYFGNNLDRYQTSMQDQLTHQSMDRSNKALGLRSDGNNEAPGNIDKKARKQSESAADYLKRIGN